MLVWVRLPVASMRGRGPIYHGAQNLPSALVAVTMFRPTRAPWSFGWSSLLIRALTDPSMQSMTPVSSML